jgi:hypothetical protein
MAPAPWIVSEELWSRIEPLLPRVERCFRYPGRKRLPDRQALQGILFVLLEINPSRTTLGKPPRLFGRDVQRSVRAERPDARGAPQLSSSATRR